MPADQPFRGSLAVRDGSLTRHQLTHGFKRIHRDVYVRKDVRIDAVVRARAAHEFAGRAAVCCGMSAAALHGARWIDPDSLAEVIWLGRRRQLDGIRIRFDTVRDVEITTVAGLPVTTIPRTMFDLARRLPRVRAVQVLDDLSGVSGISAADVLPLCARYAGLRGVSAARSVLALVDGGAESPQETATRLLLVDAGLPPPETQIRVADEHGMLFARCDLGWPEWKVAVEYDGVQHWTSEKQRSWDIERFERLERAGWLVVRVNSEQLRLRPREVVERVRRKLRQAGAPV
ncbi:hypothetical protein CH289_01880 [Rhodococcus sp. RS1C4]|nr:DUF559 domain-containing protein [Rhodococcus sp. RS1C4]OZC58340.1 hypothetical protein CH289_01880 [Rhodococcus sp. RS1C4]